MWSSRPPLQRFLLSRTHREALVTERLHLWLKSRGWSCKIAKAKEHGIDIPAHRDGERWVIEVKGYGANIAQNHSGCA